jgi:pyruvate dehydrogenase E1 component
MRQMMERQEDVFYYVTLMNENYAQPSLPAGVESDLIKGLYRCRTDTGADRPGSVRLLGSGAILREVMGAAELLAQDWQVEAEVWSATSFSELARDAADVERWNRLHPEAQARRSHVETCLAGDAPIVAATDYVRAWPQLIAPYLSARFTALGTDGFGRSDTRAALRAFFEVNRFQIVLAALQALVRRGELKASVCADAIRRYGIGTDASAPWSR